MATTKRTKTTNKPSLKSQGARYSTTNRKGETTYYKSSKDAPGYTDTFQGKGTMSKGNAPISRVDSKGAVLATNIGTTSPVIPPKPVPTDTGDMLGMNNASVLQEGLTLDGGQFVKDESASDVMNATKEANANMGNIASQVLGYLKPDANQAQNAYEDTYGITSRQAGREYRRAQQEVQQYTSQLNSITSSRDAAVLALEDTGRGQTTGFIGGEQGRIQRQAAIAALPVQAQLAAAQGNLEIAKSHVDSLFQMKIKDIETEQAYKQTVANTWMSVANQQQSNLLNAAIADSNARAAEKSQALAMANDWAKVAIEYGQSTLAGKIMKLDPTSKTFQQDLAVLQGQVVKPMSASKRDTQVVNGQLIDMQTGEVISIIGGGTASDQLYTGLSAPTATAVRGLVSKFSSEPTVQNFATIQDGYNFAQSISDTTVNPADDQALIYSLAKALDPGSVVREGEYATAQKYAQSWISSFGKGVEQAIAGTGFLSETARKNIKNVIETKYDSTKKSYTNLQDNYAKNISSLTGRDDGKNFLIDYVTPVTETKPEDATAQLDSIIGTTTTEKKGFWDSFLNVFGL